MKNKPSGKKKVISLRLLNVDELVKKKMIKREPIQKRKVMIIKAMKMRKKKLIQERKVMLTKAMKMIKRKPINKRK